MDPTQTLADILETLAAGSRLTTNDRADALELLRVLGDWLRSGGFAPDVPRAVELAGYDLATPEAAEPATHPCPACGEGMGTAVGTLGRIQYFRCRACGATFSEE